MVTWSVQKYGRFEQLLKRQILNYGQTRKKFRKEMRRKIKNSNTSIVSLICLFSVHIVCRVIHLTHFGEKKHQVNWKCSVSSLVINLGFLSHICVRDLNRIYCPWAENIKFWQKKIFAEVDNYFWLSNRWRKYWISILYAVIWQI